MSITPFSNASEAMSWKDCNCDKCDKYESISENREDANCKYSYDIDFSFITGELSEQTADAVGLPGDCRLKTIAKEINLLAPRKFKLHKQD